MKPIIENAKAYNLAFEHFNKELFLGKLKAPMLILTRDARVIGGHFAPSKWADESGDLIHEIAINANWMVEGDPMTLFCVLAHEMVHLWQNDFGKPTRGGYHNEEWMKQAHGLGLKTEGSGQRVHTEIEPGGAVEAAIASMPEAAVFPWMSAEVVGGENPQPGQPGKPEPPKGKSGIRARYTCPICGLNAWAKPGASLVCGDDGSPLVEQVKKEEVED